MEKIKHSISGGTADSASLPLHRRQPTGLAEKPGFLTNALCDVRRQPEHIILRSMVRDLLLSIHTRKLVRNGSS